MHNEANDEWFLSKVKDGTLLVSENGKVFNTKTKRYIGAIGSGEYPKISMMKERTEEGKKIICHMQIHRLVWLVYRGHIPQNMQVNHKDVDKNNPSLLNLELTTQPENMQHALKAGVLNTFKKGNTIHLKRKTYGNRYRKGITPVAQR